MPIVMTMTWEGVSREQYDSIKRTTNFENDVPTGAIFHVAAFDGGTMRVTDVWESADDFQRFIETKVMPAVAALGIETQPTTQILETHNVFNPRR